MRAKTARVHEKARRSISCRSRPIAGVISKSCSVRTAARIPAAGACGGASRARPGARCPRPSARRTSARSSPRVRRSACWPTAPTSRSAGCRSRRGARRRPSIPRRSRRPLDPQDDLDRVWAITCFYIAAAGRRSGVAHALAAAAVAQAFAHGAVAIEACPKEAGRARRRRSVHGNALGVPAPRVPRGRAPRPGAAADAARTAGRRCRAARKAR